MNNIVAKFEIKFLQYLDENGKLVSDLPEFAKDFKALVKLYKNMLLARIFDKKAIALQRTGKMGTYAPINGQEAIASAIGQVIQPHDVFVPYYRDYAAQFQRGVKMSEILAYWGGDERGSQFSCGGQDLPICVPIASQCLHAAGVAFAFKYRKESRVAVVCIGDGGTSEGDFYEAMNVAGVWKLPVIFVVNNNKWAISVNIDKQTASQTIAQKAIAAGFEGIQVDGNDAIAMRSVMDMAINNARLGNGPMLIEAITYRLCDHTTADDATRYQPKDEVSVASTQEPIRRLRVFLESQNLWSQKEEEEYIDLCNTEVQNAVDEYLATNTQNIENIFDFHYEKLPDYMLEQRAIAMEEFYDK